MLFCRAMPCCLFLSVVWPGCAQRQGEELTPTQFEILGGRGKTHKWKTSLSAEDSGQLIPVGKWLEKYEDRAGTCGV